MTTIFPWCETKITLTAQQDNVNPYVNQAVWAGFLHESGRTLRRPTFWDGAPNGRPTGKVRFAAPEAGCWTWRSTSSPADAGLTGQSGELSCETDPSAINRFYRRGFWRMSIIQPRNQPCLTSNLSSPK